MSNMEEAIARAIRDTNGTPSEIAQALTASGYGGFEVVRGVSGWRPIETAPKDGATLLAYASPAHGLDGFQTLCSWHPDAGFCVDELREATHWMPLPPAPEVTK
jgi:hypothetical protein